MKIKKFRKKDEKEVKELVEKVIKEIFKSKPEGLQDLNNIKKNFEIFLVAKEKGEIIGCIGLNKDKVIKRMYIKNQYRNEGFAQKLYDKIEEFARKKGIEKLRLSTTPQMKAAINFYKKNKFKKKKEKKKTNQIFLEKRLI